MIIGSLGSYATKLKQIYKNCLKDEEVLTMQPKNPIKNAHDTVRKFSFEKRPSQVKYYSGKKRLQIR